MKRFFVRHPQYLKHPENDLYFRKWLTDAFLDTGIKTTRWEDAQIEEMFKGPKRNESLKEGGSFYRTRHPTSACS
jgi:hypothetical protein